MEETNVKFEYLNELNEEIKRLPLEWDKAFNINNKFVINVYKGKNFLEIIVYRLIGKREFYEITYHEESKSVKVFVGSIYRSLAQRIRWRKNRLKKFDYENEMIRLWINNHSFII
jgi:hypothetical protein